MAKTTDVKRKERLKVNVTAAEKTELVRRAGAAGQSLSDQNRSARLSPGGSPSQSAPSQTPLPLAASTCPSQLKSPD